MKVWVFLSFCYCELTIINFSLTVQNVFVSDISCKPFKSFHITMTHCGISLYIISEQKKVILIHHLQVLESERKLKFVLHVTTNDCYFNP